MKSFLIQKITHQDKVSIFYLYICMNLSRYLAIMCFYKILRKQGYGFQHRDAVVLTYGGIRGAIGISFALIVQHDAFFDDNFKHTMLLHMSGCALITLISTLSFLLMLVNAPTMSAVIRLSGMIKNSITKQVQFQQVTQHMIEEMDLRIEEIKDNVWFKDVNWEYLREINNFPEMKEQIYTLKMNIESF